MLKVNFPKTEYKLKLCWSHTDGGYSALAETENTIIIYEWDGISLSWSEANFYPKQEIDYGNRNS